MLAADVSATSAGLGTTTTTTTTTAELANELSTAPHNQPTGGASPHLICANRSCSLLLGPPNSARGAHFRFKQTSYGKLLPLVKFYIRSLARGFGRPLGQLNQDDASEILSWANPTFHFAAQPQGQLDPSFADDRLKANLTVRLQRHGTQAEAQARAHIRCLIPCTSARVDPISSSAPVIRPTSRPLATGRDSTTSREWFRTRSRLFGGLVGRSQMKMKYENYLVSRVDEYTVDE